MPLSSSLAGALALIEAIASGLLELELAPRRHAPLHPLQDADGEHAGASQQEHADPHGVDLEALRRLEDQVAEAGPCADELADDDTHQTAADTQSQAGHDERQ